MFVRSKEIGVVGSGGADALECLVVHGRKIGVCSEIGHGGVEISEDWTRADGVHSSCEIMTFEMVTPARMMDSTPYEP